MNTPLSMIEVKRDSKCMSFSEVQYFGDRVPLYDSRTVSVLNLGPVGLGFPLREITDTKESGDKSGLRTRTSGEIYFRRHS